MDHVRFPLVLRAEHVTPHDPIWPFCSVTGSFSWHSTVDCASSRFPRCSPPRGHSPASTACFGMSGALSKTLTYSELLPTNGPGWLMDILQGEAKGDEFRTRTLWVSAAHLFLHDGDE